MTSRPSSGKRRWTACPFLPRRSVFPWFTAGAGPLWGAVLRSGVGAGQVAQGFVDSAEFLGNLVADYYTGYLGRAAAPAEIDLWRAALQSGMTYEQMAIGFLNSAEFFAHQGGTS